MASEGRIVPAAAEGWPYAAPVDDGAARHLMRGKALPDILLPATRGPALSLARFPGRLAVFIYPWTGRPGASNPPGWDDIPGAHGSTPELTGLANLYTSFLSLEIDVVAISAQSTEDQREFATRLQIPFPLLSDAEGVLAAALRLPTFMAGPTRYLSRLTLATEAGRIAACTYPVFPPHTHARAVLAEMTAASSYAAEARRVTGRPPQGSPGG